MPQSLLLTPDRSATLMNTTKLVGVDSTGYLSGTNEGLVTLSPTDFRHFLNAVF